MLRIHVYFMKSLNILHTTSLFSTKNLILHFNISSITDALNKNQVNNCI